ncbi:MAG: cyclic nucleotide-binding protein [Alphaproteobacteria bacterium]|nr:MAG: cyclic nucleotide-binding protein [Alphaproteobacteria bacterium]
MLRRIPLFAAIDPAKLKLLAFASDRMIYHDGQPIFRQGEVGDAAYVVVKGTADIVVETDGGDIVVAQARENAVIGEIAILCDVPRTATVRANGEVVALKIKKEHFLSLMQDFPKLGIQVMRELASRLSRTTTELTEARRRLDALSPG